EKKLFARKIKDKKGKDKEKELLDELDLDFNKIKAEIKSVLVEKLYSIVNGKTSQGVFNNFNEEIIKKGTKFTLKLLNTVEFENIKPNNWTNEDDKNKLVKQLMYNYHVNVSEAVGDYKREKFAVSVSDELPTCIVQLAKVYVAKKRKLKVGAKMA